MGLDYSRGMPPIKGVAARSPTASDHEIHCAEGTKNNPMNSTRLARQAIRGVPFWVLAGFVGLSAAVPASYAQGGGPPGGNVRALALDPVRADTLYAGTGGGVFKSTNAGTSWRDANSGLTNSVYGNSVYALAIDPSENATVYAGGDAGVFKSTNGGTSWAVSSDLEGTIVLALAINPSAPATIYAGLSGGGDFGVAKSANGGASWTGVFTNNYVPALAIDPSAPATLYAGTWTGVFKSTNGGTSWSAVNSGLTNLSITTLAINPTTPATLYAGTAGGVFRSTNGGASWSAVNSGLTNLSITALAINPTTPATLYAGTEGGGLFRSTNGGISWSAANSGLTNTFVSALAINPTTPNTLYAGTGDGVFKTSNGSASWSAVSSGITSTEVGALAIDPAAPATIYVGTFGGGVFKSTDSGASWNAVNSGLTYPFASALAIDPGAPATIYAGTFGGVFKSTNGGASWSAVSSGLTNLHVRTLAINPLTPATLYAGTEGSGVFRSTNGGISWSAVNSGLTSMQVLALTIDPASPATLYAGTGGGGVFKSTNGGTSWSAVNSGLTNQYIAALVIDRSVPATLYAGTGVGGVFKSTNGGTNWSALNPGLDNPRVAALAIDPSAPATIYAGLSGAGVLKGANEGSSWTAVNSGLTYRSVNALAIAPSAPATLYAGTDGGGVFKTTDGAGTWQPTGANLQQPILFSLVDRGGVSLLSSGASVSTVVGYASIQPDGGMTTPSGLAIFGYRPNNILVSEASVPAPPLLQFARIYAEIDGPVNTGLAIANPNNQPASISFFFTGSNGNFGSGTTTIPANGQIAKFLSESPFDGGSSVNGSFTFSSSLPVAVVGLRGLTNERGEFLLTTLPIADLGAPAATATLVFPQFADGAGWTTQIVLVNPTDSVLTGTIQFLNASGGPAVVGVNGLTNSVFTYSIPARMSQKLQTSGTGTATQSGSVRVIPSGDAAPSGLAVFSFRTGGITVSEAGVPSAPAGNAFRLYAEVAGSLGQSGSIQTGLAVTNNSASVAAVTLELHRLDGSSTGLTGNLSVPANGRVATFLNEVQGFASLAQPFQGILRVSSVSSISVVGLRGRYNERTEFLMTTTPATNEVTPASTAISFFPHFADGGGFTTQFILFSGQPGQSSAGNMRFFSQSGTAAGLRLTGTASAAKILYSTAFESYSLGSLTGQDSWSVFGNSAAVTVQSTVVFSGSRAVLIDAAVAGSQTGPHHLATSTASETVVRMEADVRLDSSTVMTGWQFAAMNSALNQFLGGFNVLSDGRVQIITAGNPVTTSMIPRNVWNHYAVAYEFTSQTFNVYINGVLIRAGNSFATAQTTFGRGLWDTFGGAGGNDKGYIDNFQIASIP